MYAEAAPVALWDLASGAVLALVLLVGVLTLCLALTDGRLPDGYRERAGRDALRRCRRTEGPQYPGPRGPQPREEVMNDPTISPEEATQLNTLGATVLRTVGDLRALLAEYPDTLPLRAVGGLPIAYRATEWPWDSEVTGREYADADGHAVVETVTSQREGQRVLVLGNAGDSENRVLRPDAPPKLRAVG